MERTTFIAGRGGGMSFWSIASVMSVLPDARFVGATAARRRKIGRFSTDSRSLKTRDLFIALVGERFDGHDYVHTLPDSVSAAMVNASWYENHRNDGSPVALIVVDDTLHAYGEIAAAHRRRFAIPVVAIAGSNGKTTTKELVADVLATRYEVLRTEGNLNNLIGVPATILRMNDEHTAAVIEIGTNTPGEIERLSEILQPTHGVITNIGAEHLELLGSLEGVAEEEGALFRYLDSHRGTVFVYLDDPYIASMARGIVMTVTYGRTERAAVRGRTGSLDANGAPFIEILDTRRANAKPISVQLATPGLHTATNALAAAAIGLSLKVSPPNVKRVLATFTPRTYAAGYARLAVARSASGATILNDTYNANPDSVIAALETLRAMKPRRGGRRIVVLGEMKELGASSASEHARVGRAIAEGGSIDSVMFFGDEMRHADTAIRQVTNTAVTSRYYEDKTKLAADLARELAPGDIVLVKGSRGMKMEEVVAAILS